MANLEHKDIPDANIHQPKGAAAALAGALIVCDGAGTSATSGTPNTPANMYDNEFRRPALKDYSEPVNILGSVVTTQAINFEAGNVVSATMTGDTTFTFTNPPVTGKAGSFMLELTQGGAGSCLATWPAEVTWAGGTPPTLTTTVGGVDILTFTTLNAGSIWRGFVGGKAFA